MSAKKLLIDLGNSSLKYALFTETLDGQTEYFNYHPENFNSKLNDYFAELEQPAKVVIASVASAQINQLLKTWVQLNWAQEVNFVLSVEEAFGLKSCYQQPAKLGVDRFLAMIAVKQLATKAFCVVDCGTCTTIDKVDAQGNHLGGLIIPGPKIMFNALKSYTAIDGLDLMDTQSFSTIMEYFGGNTEEAVTFGVAQFYLAGVGQLIDKLQKDYQVFLTGGYGSYLAEPLGLSKQYFPDLVIDALNLFV